MSAKKRTTDAPVTTDKKEPAKTAGYSVYIGPSLKGIIQTRTIMEGSRAEALKRPEVVLAISKKPAIKGLIVDGIDLPEALTKVKTHGSDLYKLYRSIVRNE